MSTTSEQRQEIQPVTLEPGIYSGISNSQYHADKESYSSSIIKLMGVPAEAKYAMDNPNEFKEAYRIGSAIHKFILEPDDFAAEFLTGIDCARRSKADKQAWADWYSEHGADGDNVVDRPAAEWNGMFVAQTSKHMVTPEEIQNIGLMAESVKSNPNAVQLLEDGLSEQSIYWVDKETGLRLRVRPDYLNDDFTSDLKSIDSLHDYAIDRAIANLSYDIQEQMYSDGVMNVTGEYRPFLFIFIQKKPPFMVRVIGLSEACKTRGWEKYRANVNTLSKCLESNEWYGLPDDLNHQLFQKTW
jgi:hypothetical protein